MSNSNSTASRIDVFFYGLFMDEDVLKGKGVNPTNRRLASVDGFALMIGQRATLVPTAGDAVYGVVFSLTHEEIERLYGDPSVKDYRPEAVLARLKDGDIIPTLCFNLSASDSTNERNVEYATKLRELATRLSLPMNYVQRI